MSSKRSIRQRLLPLLFVPAILFTGISGSAAAEPLGFADAVSCARSHDAEVRGARADYDSSKEEVEKARAALRPTLKTSGSFGLSHTEHTYTVDPSIRDISRYSTQSQSLSLRQTVFNLPDFAAYGQSKRIRAKGELLLAHAEADLISRTAEAYFNVLYADESVTFSKASKDAMMGQLDQAEERYAKGFGTVTEINEARAAFDMAKADYAGSLAMLEFNRRELERITGVYAPELRRINSSAFDLSLPYPQDVDFWIAAAKKKNRMIGAAGQDVEIARREVKKKRASRYPVVELWAGRNFSVSENNYTIGSQYDTYSVSLQTSLPIYSGGRISAEIRQAKAQQLKAMEQLSWQERAVSSDIRKFYNGMVNGVDLVRAYEQAVESYEVALDGTRKGYRVGLRTNVDVLDAERKLLDGRRSLAKARYQYLINRLMLEQSAGTLGDDDVAAVDAMLNLRAEGR